MKRYYSDFRSLAADAFEEIFDQLAGLKKLMKENLERSKDIMATQEEFNEILSQIDSETTRVADKVQQLMDQLATGGMSADQEAQVKADLQAQLDKLRGIGADPTNPVP